MPELFLGVDGGQSSTVAVIGDGCGKVIGWGTAGPSNHVAAAEGRSKFLRVMRECLSHAAAQAGISTQALRFRAACLGMSGGPEDKQGLLGELIEAEHLLVTHDAQIALAGATAGGPGVIVIAGTGSIAFGQNLRGETARAGGWGYLFGDEGGGFDIAKQAVRAMLREHEGWGAPTALTPAMLEALGSGNANDAMHLLYTAEWPRARVAGLAALVSRIAEAGDPVAIEILEHAADSLAGFGLSVRQRLWGDELDAAVSWIGGVFRSPILLNRFRTIIPSAAPPKHSPAVGALLLAWKTAGLNVVPEAFAGLKT